MSQNPSPSGLHLREIASLFLKLGFIAFGGPAAHIAMMEDEVVKKRKWMSQQHFLDLIGATNLIPGPNSTEMTMHCGYERGGYKGLFIAGACFIFPAVLITGFLAWLYVEYGTLPEVEPFIYGIKPAVIAIILMAGYRLGKKAVKSVFLAVLGVLGIVAILLGYNEIVILFLTGFIGLLAYALFNKSSNLNSFLPLFLVQALENLNISNLKIFLIFLKVGAILYGSGYVLFAFLESELVGRGWLTNQQLLDAVAIGQMTPGPVLSTATFIGWQMNGLYGALAATVGIFLPSFIFVLIFNPYVPKMRKSPYIGAFLDAVNVAAVALIIAVTIQLGMATLSDWRAILIAILSLLAILIFKKVNSAYIVLGGAVLGYLLHIL